MTATAETRTLTFAANADPFSPTAGLLTIDAGKSAAAYVVTEFASPFPGRYFHLAKVGGDAAGYTVFACHHGPDGDSCDCPAAYFRGKCRHKDAIRKLLEVGKL
jgi:hypothetical protein